MDELYQNSDLNNNWSIKLSVKANEKAKEIWKNTDAVIIDVDGTLIQELTFFELVKFCGKEEAVFELIKLSLASDFIDTFTKCIEFVKPSLTVLSQFNNNVNWTFTPKAKEFVKYLQDRDVPIFLVSGSLKSLIVPIAKTLNIPADNVYSNAVKFDINGEYNGITEGFMTKSYGKAEVAHMLRKKHGFKNMINLGDGLSDLEAAIATDAFIGYGGNYERKVVKDQAMWYITDFGQLMSLGMNKKLPEVVEPTGSASSKHSDKSKASVKSKSSKRSTTSSTDKNKKSIHKTQPTTKLHKIKESTNEASKESSSIMTKDSEHTSQSTADTDVKKHGKRIKTSTSPASSTSSDTSVKHKTHKRPKAKSPKGSLNTPKIRTIKKSSHHVSDKVIVKKKRPPIENVMRKDFGFNADQPEPPRNEDDLKLLQDKLKEKENALNEREKQLNDREEIVTNRENFLEDELFFMRRKNVMDAEKNAEENDSQNDIKENANELAKESAKGNLSSGKLEGGMSEKTSSLDHEAEAKRRLEESFKQSKEKLLMGLEKMKGKKGDNISVDSSKLSQHSTHSSTSKVDEKTPSHSDESVAKNKKEDKSKKADDKGKNMHDTEKIKQKGSVEQANFLNPDPRKFARQKKNVFSKAK